MEEGISPPQPFGGASGSSPNEVWGVLQVEGDSGPF